MIARISCSRTSNETSVSALTPPNVNDTCSICSNTPPIFPVRLTAATLSAALCTARCSGAVLASCDLRHRCVGFGSAQRKRRGHLADAAVLETHLGLDVLRLAAGPCAFWSARRHPDRVPCAAPESGGSENLPAPDRPPDRH